MKQLWRYWARALGEKIGEDNKKADTVAWIRTFIILQAIITNILIAVNILINWFEK
jgi:hypothetical protein